MKNLLYTLIVLFMSINVMGQCVYTDSLLINTGYDPSTNSVISTAEVDPQWGLLNFPPLTDPYSIYPDVSLGTSYAINTWSTDWWCSTNDPLARPISPNSIKNFNANNLFEQQPFKLKRTFCVSSDVESLISFCISADDAGRLTLIGPNNEVVLSYTTITGLNSIEWDLGTGYGNAQNFQQAHCYSGLHQLEAGTYSIVLEILNAGETWMGIEVSGSVSSTNGDFAYSNPQGCCDFGDIAFIDIFDENCNGVLEEDEVSLPNVEFNLVNNFGTVVATSITDVNGELFFLNVPFGQYTVIEVGGGADALSNSITLTESNQNLYFTFYDCDTTLTVAILPPTCCQTDLNLSNAAASLDLADNATGTSAGAIISIGQVSGLPISEVSVSIADINYTIDNSLCSDCTPNFALPLAISSSATIGTGSSVLTAQSVTNSGRDITWSNPLGAILSYGDAINFDFDLPAQASIPCCMTAANVCVNVSWKDANCMVCDTVLCFTIDLEPEPEPCDITLGRIGDFFKCGSSMNITWNAANTNGDLLIYVADNNGNLLDIARNIDPAAGLYVWQLPTSGSSMFPCETDLTIVIESGSLGEKCRSESKPFQFECCDKCECGKWSSSTVSYVVLGEIIKDPRREKPKVDTKKGWQYPSIQCGKMIETSLGVILKIKFPEFVCDPSGCDATYSWEVIDENRDIVARGTGRTAQYKFINEGRYYVKITPNCGGVDCDPCYVMVGVKKKPKPDPTPTPDPSKCDCGEYKTKTMSVKGLSHNSISPLSNSRTVFCGSNITERIKFSSLTFTAPVFACKPDKCFAEYKWEVLRDGKVIKEAKGKTFNYGFMGLNNKYQKYVIRCTPICGGVECKSCEITLYLPKR